MLISVHTLSFYENTQEIYFIPQSIVFDYLLDYLLDLFDYYLIIYLITIAVVAPTNAGSKIKKVTNVVQPQYTPTPPKNWETREIDRHDHQSHQIYKFKLRHHKSDR